MIRVQTLAMFLGESLCMFVFVLLERRRKQRVASGNATDVDIARGAAKPFPISIITVY